MVLLSGRGLDEPRLLVHEESLRLVLHAQVEKFHESRFSLRNVRPLHFEVTEEVLATPEKEGEHEGPVVLPNLLLIVDTFSPGSESRLQSDPSKPSVPVSLPGLVERTKDNLSPPPSCRLL